MLTRFFNYYAHQFTKSQGNSLMTRPMVIQWFTYSAMLSNLISTCPEVFFGIFMKANSSIM
jgi:hypothetical protein